VIFRGYLELGSLTLLLQDLRGRGILTKANPRRDGSIRGGIPFDRGGLAALLKNRTYLGEVIHKGRHFAGEHQPIVARDLFDAVQTELAARARNRGTTTLNRGSLLKGLLYDEQGRRMAPSTAKKNGARYRYYVSNGRVQGRGAEAGPIGRVSAPDIEAAVLQALGIDTAPPSQTSIIEGEPSARSGQSCNSRSVLRTRGDRLSLRQPVRVHLGQCHDPKPVRQCSIDSSPDDLRRQKSNS
jgi:site-specific DNA recombinase